MEFQIGDTVQVRATLLKADLAKMIGDRKAEHLVGRHGCIIDCLPLSDRPYFVQLSVGGAPVGIRLRDTELSLVAPAEPDLPFGAPAAQLCFA